MIEGLEYCRTFGALVLIATEGHALTGVAIG
jgi:hypothetical protein